jgi:hypothetical protein
VPDSGVRSWESEGLRAESKEFGCDWSHEGPFLEMKPSVDDFRQIVTDLQRVREAGVRVFGSESHGFEMNPVLSETEVRAFEKKHKIMLPADYRLFLLHVGRGGAGPAYGLFNLGEMDDDDTFSEWREGDYMVGKLREPFPFVEAWNDMSGFPDDDVGDESEYERQMNEFDKRYFKPLDGAIPICHLGCAHRQWLVVTGQEAGNVWNDDRTDQSGMKPASDAKNKRLTFFRWYRGWLDEAVAILEKPARKKRTANSAKKRRSR